MLISRGRGVLFAGGGAQAGLGYVGAPSQQGKELRVKKKVGGAVGWGRMRGGLREGPGPMAAWAEPA